MFIVSSRIFIWIIGTGLIIIVTFLIGALIPIKDKKINDAKNELESLEYKREVRIFQNNQDYLHYTLKDKIIRLTLLSQGLGSESKKALYAEYLEARRLGLVKLYIMHIGENPPGELSSLWNNMSYEELQVEINKVLANSNLQKLLNDIKLKKDYLYALENNKSNLLIFTTLIQVLGLLLISFSDFLVKK